VKFRDAELTGIPLRVTVGRRGLAEGTVEITERATGETRKVAVGDAAASVSAALAAAA
jgi:prolyl-tRNA synthetase